MNSIRCSICSTVRAAAFPFAFRNLRKRKSLPALCGILALIQCGAWVGAHAQATNFGTLNVGKTSATPISITLSFDAAKTLGAIAVVTQGATELDYTNAGGGNCTVGTAYTAGDTCTVDVSFAPKFAGTRYGAAELLDGSGNVLAIGYLLGTGVGPQVTFLPGTQSVVANYPNNGLNVSSGVAVDGNGIVYIADQDNAQVLKEAPSAGGYTQSVVATRATNGLDSPEGVAVDGSGNLYIADQGNNRVLKEAPSAGGYTQSVVANAANNGLDFPYGIAVDASGNLYIDDFGNSRVLKETLSADSYTQSVVADAATNGLDFPAGVAIDGSGNVYIANYYGNRVLKETPTVGGYTQSVVADAATNGLDYPFGVEVDGSGNVYIADAGNGRVLKETLSAGGYTQSVVASNGLNWPLWVALDSGGNVYISDTNNYRVLKEDSAVPPRLTIGATSTDTVTVSNDGNAALTFRLPTTGDNPSVPANFVWDPSSTCVQTTAGSSAAFEIAAGASCTMAFDFSPTVTGNFSGFAVLTDNNLNDPGAVQGIHLSGLLVSQTITFLQQASPVYFGLPPITLSATGGTSGNPVLFSILSGPGSLSGTNNSILTVTGSGTIVIAANQAGNTDYTAAPQVTRSITVLFAKPAALTAPVPGSVLTGASATFTWSPGVGATEYMLYLGSTGVRSSNLFNSGQTTATSVNVSDLPVNGETIYARLYSFIGGAWECLDYTYTAASPATLTSPAPSSTLTGSSVTFNWSSGTGVTMYYLFLGSDGVGSDNLYNSGYTSRKSLNVTGLPVNGETIYARLYSSIGGAWHYVDYTYTAE
jgi:sugar lactone lactonase YvrE